MRVPTNISANAGKSSLNIFCRNGIWPISAKAVGVFALREKYMRATYTRQNDRSDAHSVGHRNRRPILGGSTPAACVRRIAQTCSSSAQSGETRSDSTGHGLGSRGIFALGECRRGKALEQSR